MDEMDQTVRVVELQIAKLELEQDDVLVIYYPRSWSMGMVHNFSQHLENLKGWSLPGDQKILILPEDCELAILRPHRRKDDIDGS